MQLRCSDVIDASLLKKVWWCNCSDVSEIVWAQWCNNEIYAKKCSLRTKEIHGGMYVTVMGVNTE